MKIYNYSSFNMNNINFPEKKQDAPSFEKFLLDKIKEVDNSQKKAEEMIQALAEGKNVDLSQVALTIAKADLDFKLLLRIRNKILDAYQEIMRMQF